MNKEYNCLICNLIFESARDFAYHLKTHNISQKDYYDKFLKNDYDGICHECGKPTAFIKLSKGYRKFCCLKCSNGSKEKQQKAEQTTFKHYGVKHPAQSKTVLAKYEQTCATNPFKSKICRDKSKQTSLERYGETSYTKTQEYREKTKKTSLEKYGYESPNQCPDVQKKQQNTCFEHYGVRNCQQSPIIRNKTKQTNLEKYGVENYTQTDEYKIKSKNTSQMKYGVPNPMQCREVMLKTKQKFRKDGKIYDSSWEYYYEQYLIQNNIKFEYQPDIFFWYEFKGKKHRYYPDFAIYDTNGTLKEIIDIKGDHLMKQMLNESTKEHQKYLCILRNNIHLLFKKDLIKLGILKK